MSRDLIEMQNLRLAALHLRRVAKARRYLARTLQQLEGSLPGLDRDAIFNMAMNDRTPKELLGMPPHAMQRIIAAEMSKCPVPAISRDHVRNFRPRRRSPR